MFPFSGHGQAFNFKSLERDSLKTAYQIKQHGLNDTIVVSHDKWDEMVSTGASYANNFKFKSVHAFVRFSVNYGYNLKIFTPYTLRLTYKIYGYSNPLTPTVATESYIDTLTIGYNPDSLSTFQDKQYKKYSNFHKAMIVLTGLYKIDGAGGTPQPITLGPGSTFDLLNFNVEGAILFQPYYKKAYVGSYQSAYGSTGTLKTQALTSTPINDYLPVTWTVTNGIIGGALALTPAKYELEWTYIDNYRVAPTSGSMAGTITEIPETSLSYNFTDNATRVWLDTNYYQIPLIYQKGYVLYRVRLVRPDSTEYRYPVYGPWTIANNTGTVSSLAGTSKYKITAAHLNDSLNWQYTVSFAEQGKYKHVMSYYDGMLKNRQSITRFNSTPGKLIATEQVYDYEGRPSISILPTPITSLAFRYQLNLALNRNTGLPYRAKDFDSLLLSVCPDDPILPPLSHSSPADIYYSPSNPDKTGFQKFVPDAGGYPLVQTIYSPGYDERVEKQGGAGDTLQIGYTHNVKNDYVGSEQMDINRLFGTNIGWAGFYRKTVSRDPNGQLSLNVTDYKGKTMMSSMVGLPDTMKHALVSNENLADSVQYTEDFIAGTSQQIIGNKRILDKNFFNEANGNNTAQYVYSFKPFQTFCAGKYLTVKSKYDYTIFDECGIVKAHKDSVIGITGVVTSPNVITTTQTPPLGFYMDKGKHSLHKELTVSVDEVDKAIDTFMAQAVTDNCMKTEPWFIKQSVLSKQFPCPEDLSTADPSSCDGKKYAMMQELYPNQDSAYVKKKYGIYTTINGVVVGNGNSDFTLLCGTGTNPSNWYGEYPLELINMKPGSVLTVGNWTTSGTSSPSAPGTPHVVLTSGDTLNCKYRYQDACVVTLPASVTKYGQTYTGLQQIPVEDFINIFNDDIAEALLPLHPEYCNLLGCVDDPFERKLRSIPDADIAEQLGLLQLNNIITADPLYTYMQNSGLYPNTFDTLAYLANGAISLNYLALTQAYCGTTDNSMLTTCQSDMFATQIASGTLINDFVKNKYFNAVRDLYLGNRSRYRFNLNSNGFAQGGCATCAPIRMDLVPDPVFSDDNASVAEVLDSFMNAASNTGAVQSGAASTSAIVNTYLNLVSGINLDTLAPYSNNAVNSYVATSNIIMQAAADSIVQDLVNCYSPNGGTLAGVSSYLMNLYNTGQVVNFQFTPAQILAALAANNFPTDDLCNPYLVNYDNLMAPPAQAGGFMCNGDAFIADVTNTINHQRVLSAMVWVGTVEAFALNPANQFQQAIASEIGTYSSTMVSSYNSADNVADLMFCSSTDTVSFHFKTNGTSAFSNQFHPPSGYVLSLSAQCINNVPGFANIAQGYLGNYVFAVTAHHSQWPNPQTIDYTLPAWNDKVEMNNTGENPIGQCIPCTQMRTLYGQFQDTLTAYQVRGTDHPYYATMLRNFMNYTLKKAYTGNQYIEFMDGCALSEQVRIITDVYPVSKEFNTEAAAWSFLNGANNLDVSINLPYRLSRSGSSYFKMHLDITGAPKNKLRLLKNYFTLNAVDPYLGSFGRYGGSHMGIIFDKQSTSFNPSVIFPGSSAPFNFQDLGYMEHWNGQSYEGSRIYWVYTNNTTDLKEINKNTEQLSRYLHENSIDADYLPAYYETVNNDYNLNEKQAYLQKAYSFQSLPTNKVLDSLQAQFLEAGVTLFNGKQLSYGNPAQPGNIQNLYIGDPATMTNNTKYTKLQYVLSQVANNLSGSLFFGTGANTVNLPAPSGQMLTAYRCSDTAFWYRYFGAGDTLYNVFLKVPAYIDANQLASYTLGTVSPNLGDGDSRSFHVVMHSNTAPIHDITLNGYTDFTVAKNKVLNNVLLTHAVDEGIPVADTVDNCERNRLISAIVQGKINYRMYVDSIKEQMRGAFFAYIMNSGITENLFVSYRNQRFNYTLYNYDRAGNLTKTVPPAGVNPLVGSNIAAVDGARTGFTDLTPGHNKQSLYKYNTLNQVVDQQTPDGGRTEYFYDAAGRAIFSQNEKQRETGRMTYTLYDKQGRIVETGQAQMACVPYFPPYNSPNPYSSNPCSHYVNGMITPFPPEVHDLKFKTHEEVTAYVRSLQREEVVLTHYDVAAVDLPASAAGLSTQENLRKRVSCIKYFDYLQPIDTLWKNYSYAMHFSYDIDGNVKTLTRDYPTWKTAKQQFKRVDYDYDVISGKVNLLSYNKSYADQYYQRYAYDADNRITKVETSSDGYIWQRDAEYEYYQHGPLARMSLGDLRVQGVDYAYTIQGWLKAINGDLLDSLKDMGKDAAGNSIHAYDAVALSLDYFKGDYKPIGDIPVTHTTAPLKSMYNGNIPRATTSLIPFPDLASSYTYDQLNRIVRADYAGLNRSNATLTNTANYYSKYAYDPDGNLKKLVRNGNQAGNLMMDSLMYRYTNNAVSDNKLQNVNDYAANNYDNDIKNNINAAVSRYLYDATGNVIKDQVSGQDTIIWNHYNKVGSTRNDSLGNGLQFAYDGAGNRYLKTVSQTIGDTTKVKSDYYVRDAQGNILAIYNAEDRYGMSKTQWIEYIMVEYAQAINQIDFLNWVIKPHYAQNGYFKTTALAQMSKDNNYVESAISAHPVSFYVKNNTAIKSDILSHSGDYPDFYQHMNAYSNNADQPVLGASLYSLLTLEDMTSNFFKDLDVGDDEMKHHILDLMCSSTDSLFHDLVINTGTPYDTTGCSANVEVLMQVSNKDFNYFGERVGNMVKNGGYANDYWKFIKTLSMDVAVMEYPQYTSVGNNGTLIPHFQNALTQYANDSLLGGFFDYWNEAGLLLRSTTGQYKLLEVVYDHDPVNLLSGYINTVNGGTPTLLYQSLAAIPTLTAYQFIDKISTAVVVDSIIHTVYENVLKYQRISLSSHHLYGSSRLGTKDYLPGQYFQLRDYSGPTPILDTASLTARRPWYSLEYNDNISSLNMAPWSMTDVSRYLVSHQVGQKQYELTNHLGNVQATISDLPVLQGPENEVVRHAPALASVYDYYPFGMLMPGRYASDTTGKCMTISQTQWVTNWADSCYNVYERVYATLGGATISVSGGLVSVSAANASAGISFELNNVLPDIQQDLSVEFNDVLSGVAQVFVSEQIGSNWVNIASKSMGVKGTLTFGFKPKWNNIKVTILGPAVFKLKTVCVKRPVMTQQTMLVDVCNGVKDRYRFGFNGQEKVNEWAGIGNYVDFGERGEDTRTGRFPTSDKLKFKYPGYSPYSFALNRPIDGVDRNGMEWKRFNPNYTATIVFPSTRDKDIELEYDFAMKAGMNVITVASWDELLNDLHEKNKSYQNLLFGGHGAGGGDALAFFGGFYTLRSGQYDKRIKQVGKYIKSDGSAILLGCFEGAPYVEESPYGEPLDKRPALKSLAALLNRPVYANAGYGIIKEGMFSGNVLQMHPDPTRGHHAGVDELNQAVGGVWYRMAVNGEVKPVGVLSINNDGSFNVLSLKSIVDEIKGAINKGVKSFNDVFDKKPSNDDKKTFNNTPYRN
jgi:hypothetical protein